MSVTNSETVTWNPAPKNSAQRSKKNYTDNKPRRLKAMRDYRHDNSKSQTDAQYLSRDVLFFDGEGVTLAGGRHIYVLFAAMSATDGVYHSIENVHGLSTAQCFDFVLDMAERYPDAINCIYGGSYDFNMWLQDFDLDDAHDIYERQFMHWHGYRVAWRRGKSFYVRNVKGEEKTKGVTVYDVVSFFQTSFVKACDSYLGEAFIDRDRIVENKMLRSTFTLRDLDDIKLYNASELRNGIALVKELRYRLNKVGLRPRRWDGPGALAAALMGRENVKAAKCDSPPEIASAARYAYSGGRFEIIRFGHVVGKAYEYDVNSAYPAALRNVPNLARGHWEYNDGTAPLRSHFALCHLYGTAHDMSLPGPLFRRDANGTICYPTRVTGWYWTPEYDAARAYEAKGYGAVRLIEAWEFIEDDPTDRPFAFITKLYEKRKALKLLNDGAHVGIKLALNSLYGKLAQQVGWRRLPDGTLRIPPFHQIEWAGYTTSWCRAKVLTAALTNLKSVIAFETDAVFTSEPLDIPVSDDLGDFDYTEFRSLTYLQSGVYFGTKADGTEVNKTRGVDRGELVKSTVLKRLKMRNAEERYAKAKLTRFNGLGIALSQKFAKWRTWETMSKSMHLEPAGKRVHIECEYCDDTPIRFGVWHLTACPFMNNAHSAEFPIEWINPDPNMSELHDLREAETNYDDQ